MAKKSFSYQDFEGQTLAIITDIHSNIFALENAIERIQQHDVNTIFFLGDLLTFGTATREVIDRMQRLREDYQVYFVKGNHERGQSDRQVGWTEGPSRGCLESPEESGTRPRTARGASPNGAGRAAISVRAGKKAGFGGTRCDAETCRGCGGVPCTQGELEGARTLGL